MSWRTNSVVLALRNIARVIGVTGLLGKLRGRPEYEERYQRQMLALVEPGSNVWDVGANIGYYTKQFAEKVGKHGQVVAIEPNPSSVQALHEAIQGLTNVVVLAVGLGQRKGRLSFDPGQGPHSPTGRILDTAACGLPSALNVDVTTGDHLISVLGLPPPNLIKIDTEGYELDVLLGMEQLLSQPALQAICAEIHFGLLAKRGPKDAPAQIELILTKAGFGVSWPDSSHLVATRVRQHRRL